MTNFNSCRYDSEYDNLRGHGGNVTSDYDDTDFHHDEIDIDSDVGNILDSVSVGNIQEMTENLTRSFGDPVAMGLAKAKDSPKAKETNEANGREDESKLEIKEESREAKKEGGASESAVEAPKCDGAEAAATGLVKEAAV